MTKLSVTKMFSRPSLPDDPTHTTCWCSHDVSLETSQTRPTLHSFTWFPLHSFPFPPFIWLLCCCVTLLKLFFSPHAAQLHLIFSTHAFSHSPIAHCLHCLLPQGRKKRSLPPLRRKRGQAGSGADRTKPLPPWSVYRGCVTAMRERHGEKKRDRQWRET